MHTQEITNVQPNNGSVLGSTYVEITGKYFYSDANLPADIEIGGKIIKKRYNFKKL